MNMGFPFGPWARNTFGCSLRQQGSPTKFAYGHVLQVQGSGRFTVMSPGLYTHRHETARILQRTASNWVPPRTLPLPARLL